VSAIGVQEGMGGVSDPPMEARVQGRQGHRAVIVSLGLLVAAGVGQGGFAAAADLNAQFLVAQAPQPAPVAGAAPGVPAPSAPASAQGAPPASVPVVPGGPNSGTGPIGAPSADFVPTMPGEYSYDPSGRRDPFTSVLQEARTAGAENPDLPPLERISLTELNLIGIIWGGFGYSAMVQAPDGKGYSVRVGTRIGPNNGVVTAITDNTVTIEERFTDVYGKKQVREYVKRLHEKESSP